MAAVSRDAPVGGQPLGKGFPPLGRSLVALGAEGLGQLGIQGQADLGAIHRHQSVSHPAGARNLLRETAYHLLLQFDQRLVGKLPIGLGQSLLADAQRRFAETESLAQRIGTIA